MGLLAATVELLFTDAPDSCAPTATVTPERLRRANRACGNARIAKPAKRDDR
jgi:hypothetical protein